MICVKTDMCCDVYTRKVLFDEKMVFLNFSKVWFLTIEK